MESVSLFRNVVDFSDGKSENRDTVDLVARRCRTEPFKRAEQLTAVLLFLTILFLLIVRATHAGGLWRDECGALQLARMSSFAEISRNFTHEAFPLLFPATIRGYTNIFGQSDAALRVFGVAVGVLFLCTLWFNSVLNGKGVPLLSLALVGLSTTFLTWGPSLRGYGLGSVLITLAFALIVQLVREPTPLRATAACLAGLASVHCLLHNAVLLLAVIISAVIVCFVGGHRRRTFGILAITLVCGISLLPYVEAYSNASAWNIVVKSTTTVPFLWRQLNSAFGNPTAILAWIWHIALLTLIGGGAWQLYATRRNRRAPEWSLGLFGVIVSVSALIGYYCFLQTLSYTARPWYYLALIALLGVALDLSADVFSKIAWVRIGRLSIAVLALVTLPFFSWPKITERQTNIDIIAKGLEQNAGPKDLIVVSPWQFGVSFSWYYHGPTPWLTVPEIADHQVHRYDLLKTRMLSPDPIGAPLDSIRRTLKAGNRVWFVGGIRVLREGETPLTLPPAPNSKFGWDNVAYSDSWRQQLGIFIQAHAARAQRIPISVESVNNLEKVSLAVAQGWRD